MVAEVTSQGLLIPQALLGNASKVEISREQDRLVITPVFGLDNELWAADDPVWQLGQNIVEDEVEDASVNLDAHLYRASDEA